MTCQEDQKGSDLEKLWRQYTLLASESERCDREAERRGGKTAGWHRANRRATMAARSSGLHGAANSKLKVLGEGKAWGPWHRHQAQYRYLQSLGKPCATHLLGCVFWGTFVFLQNSIKLLMALLRQSELQAPLRLTFSIVWPGSGLRRILRNIWSASLASPTLVFLCA